MDHSKVEPFTMGRTKEHQTIEGVRWATWVVQKIHTKLYHHSLSFN